VSAPKVTVFPEAIAAFERRQRFWPRFGFNGAGPEFLSKTVLEVGCGKGERCLDVAARGASRVVGVDPFEKSVVEAREHLHAFPQLAPRIEYRVGTIEDLPDQEFDAVISENTFEHVMDVPGTLAAIRRRLKSGGQAYIGFGPLYESPVGDHTWIRSALQMGDKFLLPWGHVIFPEKWLFRRMERVYGKPVRDTVDWPFLALNKLSVADYRRLFRESGMKIVYERRNANFSLPAKAFGLIGKLPVLERYFTLNMFVILEK
jgi:SAM-dependent methyltransferase